MPPFNKNRIALISPNDGTDVRIGKVCRSLSKMKFDMHFIGWDRRPESQKPLDLGLTNTRIMTCATPYGRATLSGTFMFCQHIAESLKHLRPNVVSCVNEEYILAALPMRHLFYRYLVGDIFDSLHDRYSYNIWPISNALKVLSIIGRIAADRLIVTDSARFERMGRNKKKCIIVENYPEDPGPELAHIPLNGPIRIYVCGSMSMSRGLKQLIDVINATTDVEIISAGWLYDDYAKNVFAKHPKVSFHGVVTAHESLQLAAQCDAIFAFYAPLSINNQQASPNKIYDAMSVGRPVIINEEAAVSEWVVDNNVGFRVPYLDTTGLMRVLETLKVRRGFMTDFIKHQRLLFSQGYSWEKMEPRLYDLYKSFL